MNRSHKKNCIVWGWVAPQAKFLKKVAETSQNEYEFDGVAPQAIFFEDGDLH